MKFTCETSLSENGYVFIVTHGPYDDNSSREVVQIIGRSFQEYEVRHFLIDHRDVDMKLGVMDVYDRVSLYAEADALKKKFKIAMIASERDRNAFSFYEDVATNRGYNIRVFYTAEEAENWLLD